MFHGGTLSFSKKTQNFSESYFLFLFYRV